MTVLGYLPQLHGKTLIITAQYPLIKLDFKVTRKLSPFWLAFIPSEYAIQDAWGDKI